MNYKILKMDFYTSVHFGNGSLNKSEYSLHADTIFSALCIEACKQGIEYLDHFVTMCRSGQVLLSDAFPYIGKTLYIPKPMLPVEFSEEDSSLKKQLKSLEYIPSDKLFEYLSGTMNIGRENEKISQLGRAGLMEKAAIPEEGDTEPYAVGTYSFQRGNGLYLCIAYENEEDCDLVIDLMESLSYSGIGGKISSGMGKFNLLMGAVPSELQDRLEKTDCTEYMLLSVGLPRDDELEGVIQEAQYLLIRRSGFVASNTYSDSFTKKKNLYLLKPGSVVKEKFSGDIYDVSDHGRHPVYRYAKPIYLGVR